MAKSILLHRFYGIAPADMGEIKPNRPWICAAINGAKALMIPLSSKESWAMSNIREGSKHAWAKANASSAFWHFAFAKGYPSTIAWNQAQWMDLSELQGYEHKALIQEDQIKMMQALKHDLKIAYATPKMRELIKGYRIEIFAQPLPWARLNEHRRLIEEAQRL